MDVVSLVQSLMPSALHALSALVPAVPYVVVACVVYLVSNDLLDVALVAKNHRNARPADFVEALASDVADKTALTLIVTAALSALAAGGDFKAAFVAALVAAAGANVANYEQSTFGKLRSLLGGGSGVDAKYHYPF